MFAGFCARVMLQKSAPAMSFRRTYLASCFCCGWSFVFQFHREHTLLKNFRFGPMEWLWRSLTYWKLQPILRKHAPAPAEIATAEA